MTAAVETTPPRHEGLISFTTRYEEAQGLKKAARAKALARKKNADIDPYEHSIDDDTDSDQKKKVDVYRRIECAEKARRERQMMKDRVTNGFRLSWPRHVAGRVRQPFVERGFRTEHSPILKLFISRVPKGGKTRASEDKATLYVPYRYKSLTLDCPYIELTRERLGVIRLDCDAVFASPDACRAALSDFVASKAIPHLPHIITGDLMPDGTFRNPHLLFMLPPGSEAWNKLEDKRCRVDIVRLFDGVSRGLTKALLPLGVDPAAPRLTNRMKNPISPYWHTVVLNETEFLTLSEYAKLVDTRTTMDAMTRHAAEVQSGMGMKPSNIAFNVLREQGRALLRKWHYDADPRLKGSRALLADHLHVALEAFAKEVGLTEKGIVNVISNVSGHLSLHFDPSLIQSERKNKHRLMHEVAGITSVAGRQRVGAAHSAATRKAECMEKLVEAHETALATGRKLSIEQLASAAGVSRSYAYRSLAECQQICLSRCRDKKEDTPTVVPKKSGGEAETPVTAPSPAVDAPVTYRKEVRVVWPVEDESTLSERHQAWLEEMLVSNWSEETDDDSAEVERHQAWL